jgi:Icc-related predicted phosphoesterase
MIITCVSDLHGHLPKLEGGDLLIVAGDLTRTDQPSEYLRFFHWIANQKYKKKIVIAGNHDNLAQTENVLTIPNGDFEYLCDSSTEFEGFLIYGSPWTRRFKNQNPHAMAFTVDDEFEFADKFDKAPEEIDILITHEPPHGILDQVGERHVGSDYLYGWLKYFQRPYIHVFGHIHEGYGQATTFACYNDKTMISINASHVNEFYQPVNKPVRIVFDGQPIRLLS